MVDTTRKEFKKKNKQFTPQFSRAIICDSRDIRVHPYGNMARHTIGFLHPVKDTMEYNGLEGYYDEYLRGQQGQRLERFLARVEGKSIWAPVENSDQKRAVDGMDIVSTIDTRLQDLATNSLYKCVTENQADYGCVILMEVKTGYVRAISSLQYVDSAHGYAEIYNQACMNSYEPGSTFKTVTNMALLEAGKCDTGMEVPTGVRYYSEDSTARNPKLLDETYWTKRDIRRQIKRNPEWMTKVSSFMVTEGVSLQQAIDQETDNVFFDRPLMRDTKVGNKEYREILIQQTEQKIWNYKEWLDAVKADAQQRGITLEEAVHLHATYTVDQQIREGKIILPE